MEKYGKRRENEGYERKKSHRGNIKGNGQQKSKLCAKGGGDKEKKVHEEQISTVCKGCNRPLLILGLMSPYKFTRRGWRQISFSELRWGKSGFWIKKKIPAFTR
jgi:hypothetical protein